VDDGRERGLSVARKGGDLAERERNNIQAVGNDLAAPINVSDRRGDREQRGAQNKDLRRQRRRPWKREARASRDLTAIPWPRC